MSGKTDREIVRELAKQYAEYAAEEVNGQRARRARNANSLVPDRPVVWVDEVPWHEMDVDGELRLRCQDAAYHDMEWFFRQGLYRWKHMQGDTVLENGYFIRKGYEYIWDGPQVRESTAVTDADNRIISHHYEDQLDTEEKIAALNLPTILPLPDRDKAALALAEETLAGVLPVQLRGDGLYCAPWDDISRLRGVEAILVDLAEEPERMHQLIARFYAIKISQYEQMEALGLLDYNVPTLHCTPPYVDGLPAPDYTGGPVRLKDCWYRGMAQIFGSVSPAMHEEFDLNYARPLMARCGLTYYGCCEPLDNKIHILAKIPNMRKIGVSPWANQRASAEAMGGRFVFARKPNPALVAGNLDEDAIRRETRETVEACRAYGCPYELVLKDISTVSYKPQNLFRWTQIVMETIDKYY